MIKIQLHKSTIAHILMLISLCLLFILNLVLPELKLLILFLMCTIGITWVLMFLLIPQYQLSICPKQNKITLAYANKVEQATLTKFTEITFALTIIYLKTAQKNFVIPVFIDSSALKDYKQLRTYLRWG